MHGDDGRHGTGIAVSPTQTFVQGAPCVRGDNHKDNLGTAVMLTPDILQIAALPGCST